LIFAAAAVVVTTVLGGCAHSDQATPEPPKPAAENPAVKKPVQTPVPSPVETKALTGFSNRVNAYLDMHNRLERTLPNLSKETTPQAIDQHQRALAKLINAERQAAKRGDIFGPDAEKIFKSHLARIFGGPDGRQLKASIMDENPVGAVKLAVNGRYPDEVPMSTVPPQVLAALPKLPEEIEYRFVGDHLILLDVHAHTIIDYIDNALP
jgi:hypothetical protein